MIPPPLQKGGPEGISEATQLKILIDPPFTKGEVIIEKFIHLCSPQYKDDVRSTSG